MKELFSTLFGLVALIGGVWLTIVPVLILNEIKRQGAAREAEAMRITALLRVIARGDKPAAFPMPDESAEPLQSMLDDRASKFG